MMRRVVAEALGTFAIVFFGCGSIVTIGQGGGIAGHLAVNLVFGLIVAAMIYTLGPISAAHFNPAVSLGFLVAGRFPMRAVLPYIMAQCTGAILASGLHSLLFSKSALSAHYGATLPSLSLPGAFTVEVVLTFFLMLVIIAVATDTRVHGTIPALAIGMTVTLCGLFGGPLSGCSMNPARSLAPALFAGEIALRPLGLYLTAPLIGACLAGRLFEWLRTHPQYAQNAPADLA